jgi:uncharacterized protein
MSQKQLSILNDNISILARNLKSSNTRDASQGQKHGPSTVSPAYFTPRTGALPGNWRTSTAINPTISETKGPVKLHNPLLIAGFPGPGLVGSISTGFLIESLNMRQIACVESEYIMPGVIYVGGKLRHPFRLYANNKGTICVLVCETPILVQGIHRVLDAVMKWALDSKVTDVLVLEGMPMQGIPQSKRVPFILSNSEDNHTLINKFYALDDEKMEHSKKKSQGKIGYESLPRYHGSNSIEPTYIGGISGGLLSSCISNNIPCIAVLVPSLSGIPDPEGAAIILETLAKITRYDELRIDVRQLRQQGDQVKKNLEKIANSIRSQQRSMKENETGQGEEENLMYG